MMVTNRTELEEFVNKAVKDAWILTKRAYPLTTLGAYIAETISNPGRIMGMKLRPFLEYVMRDRLHFIEHPENSLVQAVLPIEVSFPENIGDLFESTKAAERTQFDRDLWNAFAKPINDGKRAVELIKSDDEIVSFSILELAMDDTIPEGSLLVPPERIATNQARSPFRGQIIYENIEKWLQSNNLSASVFRPRLGHKDSSRRQSRMIDIVQAFEIIDKDDQKRIHVPLDIVIKLLTRT